MMKVFSLSFFILVSVLVTAQKKCPIIPQPLAATASNNQFKLDHHATIKVSSAKLTGLANYLKAEIRKNASIELAAEPSKTAHLYLLCSQRKSPKTAHHLKPIRLT